MPNPIEDGYAAFTAAVGSALEDAGFLVTAADLLVDPSGDVGLDESDPTGILAAVIQLKTVSPRQTMGGGTPRYVVDRYIQVALMAKDPNKPAREARLQAARAALAQIPVANFTLGGFVERCMLGSPLGEGQEVDDPAPDAVADIISFTLRVRSNDGLGQTPTT